MVLAGGSWPSPRGSQSCSTQGHCKPKPAWVGRGVPLFTGRRSPFEAKRHSSLIREEEHKAGLIHHPSFHSTPLQTLQLLPQNPHPVLCLSFHHHPGVCVSFIYSKVLVRCLLHSRCRTDMVLALMSIQVSKRFLFFFFLIF